MIEVKLRVLDGMKRQWRDRLTTVFVRQGHYANDLAALNEYPPAQIALEHVGDLAGMEPGAFLSPSKPATAAE
jgi:hypothetical protein